MPLPPEMGAPFGSLAPLFSDRVWATRRSWPSGPSSPPANARSPPPCALWRSEPRGSLHQLPSRPRSRRPGAPCAASRILARPDRLDPRPADRPSSWWPTTPSAAPRPQDQSQGLLPRCRRSLCKVVVKCFGLKWVAMMAAPTPLEQAGPGAAIPHRLGVARMAAAAAGADQDVDRLREADGPPGALAGSPSGVSCWCSMAGSRP